MFSNCLCTLPLYRSTKVYGSTQYMYHAVLTNCCYLNHRCPADIGPPFTVSIYNRDHIESSQRDRNDCITGSIQLKQFAAELD